MNLKLPGLPEIRHMNAVGLSGLLTGRFYPQDVSLVLMCYYSQIADHTSIIHGHPLTKKQAVKYS